MKKLKRHILVLDLKDDLKSIEKYKELHQNVWPEIEESILESGIESMEIYQVLNRLFMILEVNESFSFEKKIKSDIENSKVQKWENLMSNFQKPLPGSEKGEKWKLMEKIYEIKTK